MSAGPPNPSRSIRGRVAFVTGAASGIGRATAVLLAAEGALVAAADVQRDPLSALAEEVERAGGRLAPIALDVRDDAAVRAAVAAAVATLGALDILVNCAGVSRPAAFGDEDAWRATLEVNLEGMHRVCRAALPHLERCGAGRVVNIASTEGLGAQPLLAAYTVSKHGVIGLTRALAIEVAQRGITVNAVCPGPIHTGMTAVIPDADKERWARRKTALKRYGYPEEVAHAILSLVLPASSYITGAVLPVDGGMTALN